MKLTSGSLSLLACMQSSMMMGSNANPEGPCGYKVKEFADCMSRSNGDMSACSFYFDAMQSCKVQNKMV